MSNNHNQYSQTWPTNSRPSTTNAIQSPPHPPTTQQPGAFTPLNQSRSVDTVNSTTLGHLQPTPFSPTSLTHSKPSHPHPTRNATSHDSIRGHQPPVVSSTVPRPAEGSGQHPFASEHRQWVPPGDGRNFPPPSQPPIHNSISPGRVPTNSQPDNPKKCRIPDCTYNAYYDVFEQEQTEYCGKGHELQAVSTGLVATCVMCKERPRRTNERVCGRTCREQEPQARQVQGSYYGVPVVRRESRARPT